MTSPALELQGLIYDTLIADAAVMALVEGVHDKVPTSPWGTKLAYISFGPSDALIDDADCIAGEIHSFQIDVWSRKPGAVECKKICSAVKNALHQASLELSVNALAEIELERYLVLKDPDQQTTHGVMQFRVTIEEA